MSWRKRVLKNLLLMSFNGMRFEAIEIVTAKKEPETMPWGDITVTNPDAIKVASEWIMQPSDQDLVKWWMASRFGDLPADVTEVRYHAILPRGRVPLSTLALK